MARARTRSKVHAAVLALAGSGRVGALSMEGIADRAGVSKQTLYRTWSSPAEIIFDALLSRSHDPSSAVLVPDSGDLRVDLESLVAATIQELTDPIVEPLLRVMTAIIQTDENLAALYRERLLAPQFDAVSARLERGGFPDPGMSAELLVGPILHRWLLRTGDFDADWASRHVQQVLRSRSE